MVTLALAKIKNYRKRSKEAVGRVFFITASFRFSAYYKEKQIKKSIYDDLHFSQKYGILLVQYFERTEHVKKQKLH